MSEQAPEAPARSGGGNPLTHKLGPLPLWGWLGIATALALVYVFITKSKSSGTATTGTGSAAGATSVNSPGGVDSSLVPQFVNQVYTESTPPVTNITDSGNTNTGGTQTVGGSSGSTTTSNPPASGTATTPPTTISGAPGSYTTNLSGNYDEWTSTGGYSINTVAKSHGLTAQQLIASSESQTANPNLAAYVKKGNLNAPLPNGIALFIPKANWNVSIKT